MPVVEIDGRRQIVAHAYGTERVCECGCGESFTVTSITGRQKYASDRCKDRVKHRRDMLRPEYVVAQRARNQQWARANRAVRRSNPWLHGPPAFGPYLPGGACHVRVAPAPRWPIEHRNVRALHGMITAITERPHTPMDPQWALIPSHRGCGWAVYFHDEDMASRLSGKQLDGVLFGRPIAVSCGPMHRIKSPRVTRRGRRRLRVDAITPVCVRKDAGAHTYTFPSASNLLSTLGTWLPKRLGITVDDATARIVERHTECRYVPLGGKYGTVSGWVGHVEIECNAVTHWLLLAAETLGLGGRTAFGFGRIRVTE